MILDQPFADFDGPRSVTRRIGPAANQTKL